MKDDLRDFVNESLGLVQHLYNVGDVVYCKSDQNVMCVYDHEFWVRVDSHTVKFGISPDCECGVKLGDGHSAVYEEEPWGIFVALYEAEKEKNIVLQNEIAKVNKQFIDFFKGGEDV